MNTSPKVSKASHQKFLVQVGKQIRGLREQKRWTTYDLGDKAGLSHVQVISIERGLANSPLGTYLRLSRALEVDMATLVGLPDPGPGTVFIGPGTRQHTVGNPHYRPPAQRAG